MGGESFPVDVEVVDQGDVLDLDRTDDEIAALETAIDELPHGSDSWHAARAELNDATTLVNEE